MIRNNITGQEAEWIGKFVCKDIETYIVRYIKDGKSVQEKWNISDCTIIKAETWEMN